MTREDIREGDIVEIDYIEGYTKEHINEGKALVIWKGHNNQPLVRKLDTKTTIWTCYEHIAKVVGHIDIEGYMDKALGQEPCEDCISRKAAQAKIKSICEKYNLAYEEGESIKGSAYALGHAFDDLPPTIPQPKTGYWINIDATHSKCDRCGAVFEIASENGEANYCPNCGRKMSEVEE